MGTIIFLIIITILTYNYIIKPFIIVMKLKLDHFIMITGGVKTGKSTLAVYLSIVLTQIKRTKTRIKNLFKKEKEELPVLYSNIPIEYYEHCKGERIKNFFRKKKDKKMELIQYDLTKSILLEEEIPIEKSTIYIGEFSLVADSMNWKDMYTNNQIMKFFKLFGHSFGGDIIVDTQCVEDCHHAVKKITNKYIWIYRGFKTIFNYCLEIKEIAYNYSNNGIVNNLNKKDMEEETQLIKVNKKIWKFFDYRAYRVRVMDRPKARKKGTRKYGLMQKEIVTFNKWLEEEQKKEREKEQKNNETPMQETQSK